MNINWTKWRERGAEIGRIAMEKVMAPHLAPVRRRVVAGAASVATHLLLFLVLALASGRTSSSEVEKQDLPQEETPLEIVFLPPAAVEREAVPLPEPETYQFDPANLKESAAPPENAALLASYHSQGRATPVPQLRTSVAGQPSQTGEPAVGARDEAGEAESVAAIGAWKKAVADAIGLRWDHYRKSRTASLATGSVRLTFRIDAQGQVSDIKILSNSGNPNNALLAVRSAKEARIPPIPAERLRKLPGGKVDVELTLTILPNP